MPTPFYHLSVAEELLGHPDLSPEVRHALQEQRPAFLLGNTAPDVQVVSGQERQVTHFFDLPILPGVKPAWEKMLATYRELGQPWAMPVARAAFLAGYLCHLQADWRWVLEIYLPVFGPGHLWKNFKQRLYLHNVLRAHLDAEILPALEPEMGHTLELAGPQNWLPFVSDHYLVEWRYLIAQQLVPGAPIQTVEVFAARQGISPEDFYTLLGSEARLNEEIFSRLPRSNLQSYRDRLLEENIHLLQAYFLQASFRGGH